MATRVSAILRSGPIGTPNSRMATSASLLSWLEVKGNRRCTGACPAPWPGVGHLQDRRWEPALLIRARAHQPYVSFRLRLRPAASMFDCPIKRLRLHCWQW